MLWVQGLLLDHFGENLLVYCGKAQTVCIADCPEQLLGSGMNPIVEIAKANDKHVVRIPVIAEVDNHEIHYKYDTSRRFASLSVSKKQAFSCDLNIQDIMS